MLGVRGEGRVALHEHAFIYLRFQQSVQLGHAGGFMFSAAVREQDVGDSKITEEAECLRSQWEGRGGAEEDAVDTVECN